MRQEKLQPDERGPGGPASPRLEDQFGVLAHDLRNVVGSICSCLQILRTPGHGQAAGAHARQTIRRKAYELQRLADRLLSVGGEASAADVLALPSTPGSPRPGGEPLRVLVVDDDPEAANAIATLLRLWEYRVLVKHDGSSAIAAVAEFKPDVCLLDIWMPGMNGYQVAEWMRKEPSLHGALLIAMTGYDEYGDSRLAREAGFDHHLYKPVDTAALRHILGIEHPNA